MDATPTKFHERVGRYANDEAQPYANAQMEKVQHLGKSHLCLFAKENIQANDEIAWDYGDKTENLFWRE